MSAIDQLRETLDSIRRHQSSVSAIELLAARSVLELDERLRRVEAIANTIPPASEQVTDFPACGPAIGPKIHQ